MRSSSRRDGERLYGTGERSDAVDRRGRETESYVADGPYRPEDRQYVRRACRRGPSATATTRPTSPCRGCSPAAARACSVDEDVTSRVDGAVDAARPLGGRRRRRRGCGSVSSRARRRPTRFGASRRRSAASPRPQAPWTYGPWFQTGQPNVVPPEEEAAIVKAQRDAGAPVSVAETQMHHLPCGAHEGREDAERERTAAFHRAGLARLVYFNPSLCVSYREVYDRAAAAGRPAEGARRPRRSRTPRSSAGAGRLGFTEEPLAQFDFTHPATEGFYAELVREAVELGADGWMEDFGEGERRRVVRQHDGSTGDAAHNRYPVDYHCAVQRIAARLGRPLVRFQRSGWTGAARCAEVVWGGDPTTVWGFDGLSSAATQVLSIGLSGSRAGATDIGGYNSFGAGRREKPGATEDETLTPELLTRWIELGALVPVMRTKRSGIALPSYAAPPGLRGRAAADLDAADRAAPRAQPVPARGRRGAPPQRAADRPPPRPRAPRPARPPGPPTTSGCSAPTCSPPRSSRPALTERRAWVPPGRWIDWWHRDRVLDGGREHVLPAPLGEPPLLLRAGAVLAAPARRRQDARAVRRRRRGAQAAGRSAAPARGPARQPASASSATG